MHRNNRQSCIHYSRWASGLQKKLKIKFLVMMFFTFVKRLETCINNNHNDETLDLDLLLEAVS